MAQSTSILVVEDEADIRTALCEILRDEGFHVAAACNGREALDELRSGARPTVILLDLMMPVMSGVDFRVAQLEDARLAHIPVIVLTADGRYGDAAKGLGVAAVLGKPFDVVQLLGTIERLARIPVAQVIASA